MLHMLVDPVHERSGSLPSNGGYCEERAGFRIESPVFFIVHLPTEQAQQHSNQTEEHIDVLLGYVASTSSGRNC